MHVLHGERVQGLSWRRHFFNIESCRSTDAVFIFILMHVWCVPFSTLQPFPMHLLVATLPQGHPRQKGVQNPQPCRSGARLSAQEK